MSFVLLQLSELHQDYHMSASFISALIFLTPTKLVSSLVRLATCELTGLTGY